MLQNFFIFFSILAAAAFQVSFLPHFFSAENIPDFLLILVIFWATRLDFSRILLRVIFSGIVLDWAYLAPLGLNVFAFIFTSYGVNHLARKALVEHETWRFFITLGLVALGTILNDWVLVSFAGLIPASQEMFSFGLFFSQGLLLKIVYNSIIFVLLYWPLVGAEKFFTFYGARINMKK